MALYHIATIVLRGAMKCIVLVVMFMLGVIGLVEADMDGSNGDDRKYEKR
jgi:hypothetical protein